MTEEQRLSALLHLKRYEQPPAGYYERLLQDIHRRQRVELLRQPLWKLAIERVQTFFSAHSMGNLSYAGAMSAVAIAGLLALSLVGTSTHRSPAPLAQSGPSPAPVALTPDEPTQPQLALVAEPPASIRPLAEESGMNNARLVPASVLPANIHHQPRYVIDNRPQSVEATKVSFSF